MHSVLTECPPWWWLHLEDVLALVVHGDHVVTVVWCAVRLVLEAALLRVQFNLENTNRTSLEC